MASLCSLAHIGRGAAAANPICSKKNTDDLKGLICFYFTQLAVAREYTEYHAKKFGYSKANTDFVKGYLEKLTEAGLKKNSFDIIV